MKSRLPIFPFVAYAFDVVSKHPLTKLRAWISSLLFSSKSFGSSTWVFVPFWVHVRIWCEVRTQLAFACGYPIVPAPCAEEILLLPLSGLHVLVKHLLTREVWVSFWVLYPMPVPQCSNFCRFLNWDTWVLQLYPSFSRSFWLFRVLCNSTWILGSTFSFLQKRLPGFWWRLGFPGS